jgi:hypothetical protein
MTSSMADLTDAELADFKPARDVLPQILGKENAEAHEASRPARIARERAQGIDEHSIRPRCDRSIQGNRRRLADIV